MDQHADRTLPATHDRGHLGDTEVGDDAKGDRFALGNRQRGDQRECPVERPFAVTDVAGGR